MKRIFLATVSLAAVAALAIPAAAQAPGGGGRMGHSDMMKQRLAAIDLNDDGTITQEEMKEHRDTMFDGIDTNGDGSLSKEELTAHQETMRAAMDTQRAKWQAEHFAALDTNGDGVLSQDEFMAKPSGRRMKMMDGKRGDRKVRRGGMSFEGMDKDGNGAVSKAEFEAQETMLFTRFDQDGDGVIVIDEIKPPRDGRRGGMPPPPPPEDQ
jgi:Ca2+-binding EF-hand superfamily protein